MRWRYVSAFFGKSKLMTTFTAWMSIPRVRRSGRDERQGSVVRAHGSEARRTGADEVAADAVAEVVEDAVAVVLEHLGVRVEARVAEFGDLLGEELDAVGGVAEDDGLVDLELRRGPG